MIQTAIDRYGRLDVLVNNVADTSLTTLDGTVLETEIATFDRSIASNLRSIFIATKAALPYLPETQGAIVNISSGSTIVGDTWLTRSSASTAGVQLGRAACRERASKNVSLSVAAASLKKQ